MLSFVAGLLIRAKRRVAGLPWTPPSGRVIHQGSASYWASARWPRSVRSIGRGEVRQRLECVGPLGIRPNGGSDVAWAVAYTVENGTRSHATFLHRVARDVRLQEAAHDRLGASGTARTPARTLLGEMIGACLQHLIAFEAVSESLTRATLSAVSRLELFAPPGAAVLPSPPPLIQGEFPKGVAWAEAEDLVLLRGAMERARFYRYLDAALIGLLLAPGTPLLRAAAGWFQEPEDARSKHALRLLELAATADGSPPAALRMETELRDYLRPAGIESECSYWRGHDPLLRAFEWALILSRARTGRIDVDWAARFLREVE